MYYSEAVRAFVFNCISIIGLQKYVDLDHFTQTMHLTNAIMRAKSFISDGNEDKLNNVYNAIKAAPNAYLSEVNQRVANFMTFHSMMEFSNLELFDLPPYHINEMITFNKSQITGDVNQYSYDVFASIIRKLDNVIQHLPDNLDRN